MLLLALVVVAVSALATLLFWRSLEDGAEAMGTTLDHLAEVSEAESADEFEELEAALRAELTEEEINDLVGRIVLTFLLMIGLLLFSILFAVLTTIAVVVWNYKLAKNHELLGRPGTTFGPVWAVVGWLIPLVNIVVPPLQLAELSKGANPRYPPHSPDWKRAPVGVTVIVWAVLWLASGALQFYAFFFGFWINAPDAPSTAEPDNLEESVAELRDAVADLATVFEGTYLFMLAALGLTAVTAIAFMLVIGRLTRRQERTIAAAGAVPPQPAVAW
jgi:hypothetical protein